jgi:hypothetical protein
MVDAGGTAAGDEAAGARRIGRDALVEAGANLLSAPKLADLLSFAGVRAVADQAAVRPGTITHHFPTVSSANRRPNPVLAEAVARRAVSRGLPETGHTIDALPIELANLANGDASALRRLARAMADDLVAHRDARGQSFLTAYFACVAVAPHDPDAARIVRDYYASVEQAFAGLFEALAEVLGRRFVGGVDAKIVGVALWALAEGYAVRHRADPDNVDPDVFADMTMRLFDSLTTDAANPQDPYGPEDLFVPRDLCPHHVRHVLVASARRLYDRLGRWDLVSEAEVATEACVGRAVVVTTFPEWSGLAAAVWSAHLAPLSEALGLDRKLPLDQVLERHTERLTAAARAHPQLAAAYLEGVVRVSMTRGEVDERDHTDPRATLPLHQLLVRVLYDHHDELRPELMDSPASTLAFAALVTRHAIWLALSEPDLTTSRIAALLVSFALDGARRGGEQPD